MGQNVHSQRLGDGLPDCHNFPRLIAETGGKDFILAHPSAKVEMRAVNVIRRACDYHGLQCSAALRLHVWATL